MAPSPASEVSLCAWEGRSFLVSPLRCQRQLPPQLVPFGVKRWERGEPSLSLSLSLLQVLFLLSSSLSLGEVPHGGGLGVLKRNCRIALVIVQLCELISRPDDFDAPTCMKIGDVAREDEDEAKRCFSRLLVPGALHAARERRPRTSARTPTRCAREAPVSLGGGAAAPGARVRGGQAPGRSPGPSRQGVLVLGPQRRRGLRLRASEAPGRGKGLRWQGAGGLAAAMAARCGNGIRLIAGADVLICARVSIAAFHAARAGRRRRPKLQRRRASLLRREAGRAAARRRGRRGRTRGGKAPRRVISSRSLYFRSFLITAINNYW